LERQGHGGMRRPPTGGRHPAPSTGKPIVARPPGPISSKFLAPRTGGANSVFLALVAGVVASLPEAVRTGRSARPRATPRQSGSNTVSRGGERLPAERHPGSGGMTNRRAAIKPDPKRTGADASTGRRRGSRRFDRQPELEAAIRTHRSVLLSWVSSAGPPAQLGGARQHERTLGEESKDLTTMSHLGRTAGFRVICRGGDSSRRLNPAPGVGST
jgi:hypothetical protein